VQRFASNPDLRPRQSSTNHSPKEEEVYSSRILYPGAEECIHPQIGVVHVSLWEAAPRSPRPVAGIRLDPSGAFDDLQELGIAPVALVIATLQRALWVAYVISPAWVLALALPFPAVAH
jgi:hypothetical protein